MGEEDSSCSQTLLPLAFSLFIRWPWWELPSAASARLSFRGEPIGDLAGDLNGEERPEPPKSSILHRGNMHAHV